MILVTLGTQDKSFSRLLDAIQKCINDGVISTNVIVQAGHTIYDSKDMQIFDLLPKEEYENIFKSAKVLITHGGVSSIFDGLKNNIPVIAAARLKEFGEHTNNHQLQIIDKFASEGYIIALNDFEKLGECLKKAERFKAKKFVSNTPNITKYICDFIDSN